MNKPWVAMGVVSFTVALALVGADLYFRGQAREDQPWYLYSTLEFRSRFGRWPKDVREIVNRASPSMKPLLASSMKQTGLQMTAPCAPTAAECTVVYSGEIGHWPHLRVARTRTLRMDSETERYWRGKHWFF